MLFKIAARRHLPLAPWPSSKIAVTVNGSSGGCDQIVDQLGQPSLMATETFDDGLQ
jgi:hypothetical protein